MHSCNNFKIQVITCWALKNQKHEKTFLTN